MASVGDWHTARIGAVNGGESVLSMMTGWSRNVRLQVAFS